jgi:hypothetical protein
VHIPNKMGVTSNVIYHSLYSLLILQSLYVVVLHNIWCIKINFLVEKTMPYRLWGNGGEVINMLEFVE